MLKHVVVWKINDPARKAADAAVVKRALDAYQSHPLHRDAKAIMSPPVTGRRVVDWDA